MCRYKRNNVYPGVPGRSPYSFLLLSMSPGEPG